MGKLAIEGQVPFLYTAEFIEHFKNQPNEMKTLCNDIGKDYGYSAMNVFYIFILQYWSHDQAGTVRKSYKSTL